MNATLAVMAREVSARRELFVLAAAVAVIAAAVPYLPGVEDAESVDLRTIAPLTASLSLGWLMAVIFGAQIIGRDLVDGRLGFFFARPLSALAIWGGKATAAVGMVWLCEAIVLLPSLHGGGIYRFLMGEGIVWTALVGFLVVPLMLYFLAHAVGIMVRARTAWLFLDLAGFAIFALFVWLTVLPYLRLFAPISLLVIVGSLTASLMIALVAGGAIGLAVGRVDLRRTHGALSLGLWGTLALCAVGVSAYSGWLRDFGPSDFERVEVLTVAPDGGWVEAVGWPGGRLDFYRHCLISTTDNRWLSLPGFAWLPDSEVAYSKDGSIAIWRGRGQGDEPRPLWWADLGRPDPSALATGIVVTGDSHPVLSADGSRVAVLEEKTVSIYEIDGERMTTAFRIPDDLGRAALFFPLPDSVRLIARKGEGNDHSLLIADFDAESGESLRTTQIDAIAGESWVAVDAAWERLVVWTRSVPGKVPVKHLYEAATGAHVKSVSLPGFPRFLGDGRIVILIVGDDDAVRLVVEPFDEGERLEHDLDGSGELRLSGEAISNSVVFTRLAEPSGRLQGLRVELFDIEKGQTRVIGPHLRRAFPWIQWHSGNGGGVFWYIHQPAAYRFFIDQSGALVRWDPETGELVHVVGGTR